MRYRIISDSDNGAAQLFRIDELTGGIFPLEIFDREKNDSFIFDVEARDSVPSSLPGASGPNKGVILIYLSSEAQLTEAIYRSLLVEVSELTKCLVFILIFPMKNLIDDISIQIFTFRSC